MPAPVVAIVVVMDLDVILVSSLGGSVAGGRAAACVCAIPVIWARTDVSVGASAVDFSFSSPQWRFLLSRLR